MDKAFEQFIFKKISMIQKNLELITENLYFDLILPGKWEKSKLEDRESKNIFSK